MGITGGHGGTWGPETWEGEETLLGKDTRGKLLCLSGWPCHGSHWVGFHGGTDGTHSEARRPSRTSGTRGSRDALVKGGLIHLGSTPHTPAQPQQESPPHPTRTTPSPYRLPLLSSRALRARKPPVSLLSLLPRGPDQPNETWVALEKRTAVREKRRQVLGTTLRAQKPGL